MDIHKQPYPCNILYLCKIPGDGFLACRSVCVFFTINHNALCLFRLTSCGRFAHGIAFSRHCLMASAAAAASHPCCLSFLFGWSASCCHIPYHCGSSRLLSKAHTHPYFHYPKMHLAFLTFFLCNFIASVGAASLLLTAERIVVSGSACHILLDSVVFLPANANMKIA